MIALLSLPLYLISIFFPRVIYAAIAVQGGYVLWRGLSLHRLPLVGVHDTLMFLALSTALFAVVVKGFIKNSRPFMVSVTVLVLLFSIGASMSKPVNTPLPPVLQTYWFELHVVLSFFSYALFGIGAVLGLLQILKLTEETEPVQYRLILIGYLFFSVSMIFGGIWAFLAWGTYWLWTPKEIWTTLVWLVYTLYLHMRLIPAFKGNVIVVLGIVGFLVVLFTYLGVGLLMKSSHSFG